MSWVCSHQLNSSISDNNGDMCTAPLRCSVCSLRLKNKKKTLAQFTLQYWENGINSCSQIMRGKCMTEINVLKKDPLGKPSPWEWSCDQDEMEIRICVAVFHLSQSQWIWVKCSIPWLNLCSAGRGWMFCFEICVSFAKKSSTIRVNVIVVGLSDQVWVGIFGGCDKSNQN